MGLFDTTLQDVDPTKKPNTPPAMPPVADPNQWIKDAMTKVAGMPAAAAEGVRGMFAPQSAPTVAPLHTGEAANAILPALQTADTYMRDKAAAVPGLLKDAVGTAVGAVTPPSSNYVGDGPTDPDTNKRQVNAPVSIPGAVTSLYNRMIGSPAQAALSSHPDYNPSNGVNLQAAMPAPAQDPFAVRPAATPTPAAAPAPAAATPASPTPAAQGAPAPAMTPGAAAYQKSVDEWKPKNADFAGAQLANIVAGAQPQPQAAAAPAQDRTVIGKRGDGTPIYAADVQGSPQAAAAPQAAGMLPPGGVTDRTPNLNGTPAQQTAYWAQQKAGMEERERYNDQQAAQQYAAAMMSDDQQFKREMFEYIKANGDKLGPATLQALTGLGTSNIGANQTASAGITGLASLANHMSAAAGEADKNALTARGQDLTYAGHKLTTDNDMAKAKMSDATTRAGHANMAAIHASDSTSAENRAKIAADSHLAGTKLQTEAVNRATAAKGVTLPNNEVYFPDSNTVYRIGGKDKKGNPIPAGRYPAFVAQQPKN